VLDSAKLKQLRQAVAAEDWIAASNICRGMKLERRDPLDGFRAEELAKAVSRHNALLVVDIIEGFGYRPTPSRTL
jgi:hypothetical protein